MNQKYRTERQARDARHASVTKWNKANMASIAIRLNIKTDADVLEKLSSVSNKTDYIRSLIRADIARGGK